MRAAGAVPGRDDGAGGELRRQALGAGTAPARRGDDAQPAALEAPGQRRAEPPRADEADAQRFKVRRLSD